MFIIISYLLGTVTKQSKKYFKKKNKENYEIKKKFSKEYQALGSNYSKPFSQYVKERKKVLGK